MTTTVEHDVVDGVSAWSLLRSARGRVGRVDVLRVQGRAEELASVINRDTMTGLALVESPRQPDTRVARYHGIWGRTPLGRQPDASTTWELSSGRAGGFTWIPGPRLVAVIEFAATHRGAFLVLADTDRAPLSADVLDDALDEDADALDWGKLLADAVANGWTLARVLRDEFGLEAQVFDRPDRLALRTGSAKTPP